jgi:hypothetical protein
VQITLPSDKPIRRANLLRSGGDLPFQQTGRSLSFTVPGLAEYEVAAFDT